MSLSPPRLFLAIRILVSVVALGAGAEIAGAQSRTAATPASRPPSVDATWSATPDSTVPGYIVDFTRDLAETFADRTTMFYRLPEHLHVQAQSCGVPSAYYEPSHRTIYLCYELVRFMVGRVRDVAVFPDDTVAADRAARLESIMALVVAHEVGHALIDILDLPIAGREEDAADHYAALTYLSQGTGTMNAESGAILYAALATRENPYADARREHLLWAQRAATLDCLIAGSMLDSDYPADDLLGAERARRCRSEFELAVRSWRALLGPYLKTDAL